MHYHPCSRNLWVRDAYIHTTAYGEFVIFIASVKDSGENVRYIILLLFIPCTLTAENQNWCTYVHTKCIYDANAYSNKSLYLQNDQKPHFPNHSGEPKKLKSPTYLFLVLYNFLNCTCCERSKYLLIL